MFGIRVDEEGALLRARRQPYFNPEFVFMMMGAEFPSLSLDLGVAKC